MSNYISYEETEEKANEFLSKYNPNREIPVPIEEIVELKLEISIIPKMKMLSQHGIDAFLSADFTELYIDQEHYMSQSNRSRFTLAHEVGHYVLHKDIIKSINTLEQWKDYLLGQGSRRAIYEIQADNFAGCLLMPQPEVIEEFSKQKEIAITKLKSVGMNEPENKILISFIANEVARKFNVSPKAAEIRLLKAIKNGNLVSIG